MKIAQSTDNQPIANIICASADFCYLLTMPKSGPNSQQLQRFFTIHRMLTRKEYPNCSGLSRELEVSERTILRDIGDLRDLLAASIPFDNKRNGYY